MKLALLGDIHGNSGALRAVLNAARQAGAEQLLITGDLVGYYFAPAEVLSLLAPWNRHTVRGNHEEMLAAARADRLELPAISRRYGSGLQLALEQLTADQLDELCSLPHPLRIDTEGCRILLCHGAPWDVDQYIYPDSTEDLIERCHLPDTDFVVLGHTHYPMLHTVSGVQVINPGSVGQPRNRQVGAQWGLLDTESRHVEFRVEPYDLGALALECRRRHPEIPYLAEVLERT